MPIKAINVRNQFIGKVRHINEGPIVSEIEVDTHAGVIVTSVITTSSLQSLELQVGHDVLAAVKATSVSIAKL